MSSQLIKNFLLQERPSCNGERTAVSLFSGGGISDLGYQLAGFRFFVQAELDQRRAEIGVDNYPDSQWIVGDLQNNVGAIIGAYRAATTRRLDLLVATPPCQGMSSSNPSRGKRQTPQAKAHEGKNRLLLQLIPIARSLKPRIIVAENVRQILTLNVEFGQEKGPIVDIIREQLREYEVFPGIINVADHGIPQIRKRALIVAIHKDEPWLAEPHDSMIPPWPVPTHGEKPSSGLSQWISVREWLEAMRYEPLDSRCPELAKGQHPLHFVPYYGPDRYMQISQIPPHSGLSAYDNDVCPSCGHQQVEVGKVRCPSCQGAMRNRPYVERDGKVSLIKGFRSSYRRMSSTRPAYTITTSSSHVGSDYKVHPWENRVLSILECADLQTVPRFYDWTRAKDNRTLYLIRTLVGEALPTYFAYLHGLDLSRILSNKRPKQA